MTVADDAVTAAAAAFVAVSASQVATTALAAEVARLQAVIVEQANTIGAQATVIRDLNVRIAELEGLEEPEPEPSTMLVGASVQRRAGESWAGALDRFERSIGKRVQVVRRYTSGSPSIDDGAFADVLADPHYQALILSFKSGTQTEIEAFMRALPVVAGRHYYLALYHEPDKKNQTTGEPRLSPAQFQALCARMTAADLNARRPDISLAAILTTWLERDGNDATSSTDYMPPPSPRWVLLMDPYFSKPENTYASQCGQTVALWRKLGGTRIGIAEFGIKATGQQAADQLAGILADAAADGCEVASYFDSNVGDNAGAGWYLDLRGPAAQAAFAEAIR